MALPRLMPIILAYLTPLAILELPPRSCRSPMMSNQRSISIRGQVLALFRAALEQQVAGAPDAHDRIVGGDCQQRLSRGDRYSVHPATKAIQHRQATSRLRLPEPDGPIVACRGEQGAIS